MKSTYFCKLMIAGALIVPSAALAGSALDAIKNYLNRIDRVKIGYNSFGIEVGIAPKPAKTDGSGLQERTYLGTDFRISWPETENWSAVTNPPLNGPYEFYVPFANANIPLEINNPAPSEALFPLRVYVAVGSRGAASLHELVNGATANWNSRGWQTVQFRNDGPDQALVTFYKAMSEDSGFVVFQRIVLSSDRAYFLFAGWASTNPSGLRHQDELLTILNSFAVSVQK